MIMEQGKGEESRWIGDDRVTQEKNTDAAGSVHSAPSHATA
jgi:hypothetical protein